MKSKLLRAAQNFIVFTRFYIVLKPFKGLFQKLYCLTRFAVWRNSFTFSLRGFKNRFELYAKIIAQEKLQNIYYLEFGVSKGESLRWWLEQVPDHESRFFGFDTFSGIPEDWGTKKKGSYTNQGNIPQITDTRLQFEVGMFQDTVYDFVSRHHLGEKRLVVHLDADLYSSTLYCLFAIGRYLKKDDLLIFDEMDTTTHEFRALLDFQVAHPFKYEVIGESNNFNKVVLRVL